MLKLCAQQLFSLLKSWSFTVSCVKCFVCGAFVWTVAPEVAFNLEIGSCCVTSFISRCVRLIRQRYNQQICARSRLFMCVSFLSCRDAKQTWT